MVTGPGRGAEAGTGHRTERPEKEQTRAERGRGLRTGWCQRETPAGMGGTDQRGAADSEGLRDPGGGGTETHRRGGKARGEVSEIRAGGGGQRWGRGYRDPERGTQTAAAQ